MEDTKSPNSIFTESISSLIKKGKNPILDSSLQTVYLNIIKCSGCSAFYSLSPFICLRRPIQAPAISPRLKKPSMGASGMLGSPPPGRVICALAVKLPTSKRAVISKLAFLLIVLLSVFILSVLVFVLLLSNMDFSIWYLEFPVKVPYSFISLYVCASPPCFKVTI